MAIEIAQILCNIHRNYGYDAPYKKCSAVKVTLGAYQWIIQSKQNYIYACQLGIELINEFFYRYDKSEHKTLPILQWCQKNIPKEIPDIKMTPFILSHKMESFDKISMDQIINSRFLYVELKCSNDSWSKREKPYWFEPYKNYNISIKKKLKEKLSIVVNDTLPKLSKQLKQKVYRNHSFRRVIYDTLVQGMWNLKAKQFANYDINKPFVSYLTYPNLNCCLEIAEKLKTKKYLELFNVQSLIYRKKLYG
jgi:hypothetical protein